ncbi:MAG: GatB/YqeY domain-containing protein [Desulfovibrionaceae bacterium]|nr:GatB/YqeY domain-containing protein [Desulfovibrionaceae bacterium]
MSLKKRIESDFVAAYKAKDAVRLAVLRHMKTAISTRQAELGRDKEVTEDDVLALVARQLKQRQDSVDQYAKAGRQDLADVEAAEMEVLRAYMPAQLGEEETVAAVEAAIAACAATSVKDMGRVMQTVMNDYKGRVDGKKLSELVRARLA